jgi:cell division protein FtsB
MPWITSITLIIILLLQYTLWLGKRSFPHLQETDKLLLVQKQKNSELKLRNTAMEAEIQDLKRGLDSIEEHARAELGMVKPKEILYQYLTPPTQETEMTIISQISRPEKQEVIAKLKKPIKKPMTQGTDSEAPSPQPMPSPSKEENIPTHENKEENTNIKE